MKKSLFNSVLFLLVMQVLTSCVVKSDNNPIMDRVKEPDFQYKKWTVSDPIFDKGTEGSFDELSVKDPSIVFFNNKYHLFYTSKAGYQVRDQMGHLSKNGSGLGYVAAESLEKLNDAERFDLGKITESVVVAPQVFYFEPHQLWYLVAQTVVDGKPDLLPVYMTNPDIEDPFSWTKPQIIRTGKSNNGFWIDFWVICDNEKAHLFYTDHQGSLFRFECPIDKFPDGFEGEREETVLSERNENSKGRWRLHEASHIYYVTDENKYLTILEGVYPHPTRKNYWDSRNRFLFAMVADKLEGPWERLESDDNEFMGDPANLFNEDGTPSDYDQVSHPELIRSGYNQNLEIENYKLQMLFQAFDADSIADDYDYNYLPWRLMLMKNFKI